MYLVTKELEFCYSHRLFRYRGKCNMVHGHNAKVLLTYGCYDGDLDSQGMVIDFTVIRKGVQKWLDDNWDHKMILFDDDTLVKMIDSFDITSDLEEGEVINDAYNCLKWSLCKVPFNPTAENMARYIFEVAKKELSKLKIENNVVVVEVKVYETPTSYATYSSHVL